MGFEESNSTRGMASLFVKRGERKFLCFCSVCMRLLLAKYHITRCTLPLSLVRSKIQVITSHPTPPPLFTFYPGFSLLCSITACLPVCRFCLRYKPIALRTQAFTGVIVCTRVHTRKVMLPRNKKIIYFALFQQRAENVMQGVWRENTTRCVTTVICVYSYLRG